MQIYKYGKTMTKFFQSSRKDRMVEALEHQMLSNFQRDRKTSGKIENSVGYLRYAEFRPFDRELHAALVRAQKDARHTTELSADKLISIVRSSEEQSIASDTTLKWRGHIDKKRSRMIKKIAKSEMPAEGLGAVRWVEGRLPNMSRVVTAFSFPFAMSTGYLAYKVGGDAAIVSAVAAGFSLSFGASVVANASITTYRAISGRHAAEKLKSHIADFDAISKRYVNSTGGAYVDFLKSYGKQHTE